MRIEYHPAIEKELGEIRDYYESQATGLGVVFLDEFERQVFAVAAMPTRWMTVTRDIRRSLMKRFPLRDFLQNCGRRLHSDYRRET